MPPRPSRHDRPRAPRLLAAVAMTAAGVGLALTSGCSDGTAEQTGEETVIGGTASSNASVVLLVEFDGAKCSGTLVAPDLVVTAAHCVLPRRPHWVYVGYSQPEHNGGVPPPSIPPSDGGVTIPDTQDWEALAVVDAIAHPSYTPTTTPTCPTTGKDVALLRLEKPSKRGRPMAIATAAPNLEENCTTVGFGRHTTELEAPESEGTSSTYGEQRSANVRVVGFPDGNIQTAGIDGAHSSGDSGGLLLCKGRAAGVTSCTMDKRQRPLESGKVYVPLYAVRAFLEDATATLRTRTGPPSPQEAPRDAGIDSRAP